MSSRPDIHIQTSFFTLHCDIFHLDIIPSLFSDITYHHLWYSFFVFSFIIDYSMLSLFHLEWWFYIHHCMEDCHILPTRSPCGQWSRDLILRSCLVSEDSCYISTWGEFIHLAMYFMGYHSISSEYAQYIYIYIYIYMITHCSFYYSLFGRVYGRVRLLYWVYVLGRVRMRAYSWDSSWCIFWVKVWVIHSIFVREVSDLSLVYLDPCSIHHSIYFGCNYFPYFDAGWPSLTFYIISALFYLCFIPPFHYTLFYLFIFSSCWMFDLGSVSTLYSCFFDVSILLSSLFVWGPLGPGLMTFFMHCISCMRGIRIISLGSLSLVSFRFAHLITLAYITSRVLRPPWGHDFTCCAWRLTHGQHLRLVVDYFLEHDRWGVEAMNSH